MREHVIGFLAALMGSFWAGPGWAGSETAPVAAAPRVYLPRAWNEAALALSADGQLLAVVSEEVVVLNTSTLEIVRALGPAELPLRHVLRVASHPPQWRAYRHALGASFSPDARRLAVQRSDGVILFDLDTSALSERTWTPLDGPERVPSPEPNKPPPVHSATGDVHAWLDPSRPGQICVRRASGRTKCVANYGVETHAVEADSKRSLVALGGAQGVYFFDLDQLSVTWVPAEAVGQITHMAGLPDGEVLTASRDRRLARASAAGVTWRLPPSWTAASGLGVADANTFVVAKIDEDVEIRRSDDGHMVRWLPMTANNGRCFAVGDGHFFSEAAGGWPASFDLLGRSWWLPARPCPGEAATCARLAGDNMLQHLLGALSTDHGDEIWTWTRAGGSRLLKTSDTLRLEQLAVTPDGAWGLVGAREPRIAPSQSPPMPPMVDDVLEVWDLASGRRLTQIGSSLGEVLAIRFLPTPARVVTVNAFGRGEVRRLPDLALEATFGLTGTGDGAFIQRGERAETLLFGNATGLARCQTGSLTAPLSTCSPISSARPLRKLGPSP